MAGLDADFIRFDDSDNDARDDSGKRAYDDAEADAEPAPTPSTSTHNKRPKPKGENGKSRKEIEKQRSKKAPWMADVDWDGCRTAPEM